MNIATASNAELDALALRHDRKRLPGLPYKLYRELALESTARDWLIKGIFAKGETSAWIGPPGSLKSSLITSAALSIASGTDWFGRKNKGRAAVAIFALERSDLVRKRMQAQAARDGLPDDLPIAVVPGILDLTNPRNVPLVVHTMRNIEQDYGLPVGFASFDTFAKLVAAGGGDEDKAKDQGKVFANLQRVKDTHGALHVALVGHTGKDESRGARGSNAILGDVDLMVTLSGESVRTATVTKANDAPEGPLFSFTSEVHEFGTDEDGDPITVNIVSSETVEARAPSTEPELSRNQRTMFGILHDAGPAGLTLQQWNERTKEAGIGTTRKADLYDIRSALQSKGLVLPYGDRWKVRHDG